MNYEKLRTLLTTNELGKEKTHYEDGSPCCAIGFIYGAIQPGTGVRPNDEEIYQSKNVKDAYKILGLLTREEIYRINDGLPCVFTSNFSYTEKRDWSRLSPSERWKMFFANNG